MKQCKVCKRVLSESEFYMRKETGKLRTNCIRCFAEGRRQYYKNNKEAVRKRQDNYYEKNRDAINAYKSKWQKDNADRRKVRLSERYKNEPNYRIAVNLRNRLLKAIQNNQKHGSTLEILGCSIDEFVSRLENMFIGNMSWNNHGTVWHIDHIRPCSSFDLSKESEQRICFHYTNMQPLFAKDNLVKGNRII